MSRLVVAALRENMWRALSEGRLQDAEEILDRLKQDDILKRLLEWKPAPRGE